MRLHHPIGMIHVDVDRLKCLDGGNRVNPDLAIHLQERPWNRYKSIKETLNRSNVSGQIRRIPANPH